MKKYILCCCLILVFKILPAQTWTWDSLVISDGPISLVKDHLDHVYTFTQHRNVLAKYNSTGNLLWQKIFPAYSVEIMNVICGGDNVIYLTGTFYESITIDSQTITSAGSADIFVAKLDESGVVIWLRQISSKGNEESGDLCLDKANKLLITGSTSDTTNFSGTVVPKAANRDLFITRYDLAGNFETAFFASFISSSDPLAMAQKELK